MIARLAFLFWLWVLRREGVPSADVVRRPAEWIAIDEEYSKWLYAKMAGIERPADNVDGSTWMWTWWDGRGQGRGGGPCVE